MARQLRVYGWQGWRREAETSGGHRSTREIVAAHSVAEVMRITGHTRAELFNIGHTGNSAEIELAMSSPGLVFWKPIDAPKTAYVMADSQEPSDA